MLRKAWILLFPLALVGCANDEPMSPTTVDIKKPAADNKAKLAELAKKGPVFVYFVKENCGSNPESVPLFKQIDAAYKGKVNFVAVINTDESGFKKWNKEYDTKLDALYEPSKGLMHDYDVPHSQTVVVLDKDLKETERFGGYGKAELEKLNKALAKAAKADVAKLDLSGAPDHGAFG